MSQHKSLGILLPHKVRPRLSPDTKSRCPHCRQETLCGTNRGCGQCGRVKVTAHGRKLTALKRGA